MKPMIMAVLLLATPLVAAPPEAETPKFLSADELLVEVLRQMPQEPVIITGQLRPKRPSGSLGKGIDVRAEFNLAAHPPTARYTVFDASGAASDEMTVTQLAGGEPRLKYAKGKSLSPAPAPKLSATVRDTAIRWSDLSLSFLWWRGGKVMGRDRTKGRNCIMLRFKSDKRRGGNVGGHTALWIDEKCHMLLKMEERDADRQTTRRLTIKSFKKIDDQWMIKDLEVEDLVAGKRTVLRIDSIHGVTVDKP